MEDAGLTRVIFPPIVHGWMSVEDHEIYRNCKEPWHRSGRRGKSHLESSLFLLQKLKEMPRATVRGYMERNMMIHVKNPTVEDAKAVIKPKGKTAMLNSPFYEDCLKLYKMKIEGMSANDACGPAVMLKTGLDGSYWNI